MDRVGGSMRMKAVNNAKSGQTTTLGYFKDPTVILARLNGSRRCSPITSRRFSSLMLECVSASLPFTFATRQALRCSSGSSTPSSMIWLSILSGAAGASPADFTRLAKNGHSNATRHGSRSPCTNSTLRPTTSTPRLGSERRRARCENHSQADRAARANRHFWTLARDAYDTSACGCCRSFSASS
jgi:hypothetical protein